MNQVVQAKKKAAAAPSGLTRLGSSADTETAVKITVTPFSVANGVINRVYIIAVGGKGAAAPAGWTPMQTDTSNTNVNMYSYERVCGASEPASYDFTGLSAGRIAICVSHSGAQAGGSVNITPAVWGGAITTPAVTVTAASAAIHAVFSRSQAITMAGALQNIAFGGVYLAVGVDAPGLSAGANPGQSATLASSGHRGALQEEVLAA